jgi:predicted anti-sigma-YlaC factor YlaD
MTFSATNSLLCERTRGWLSLRLDGELSEFERALMDAHLSCCAECRAFEADTAALTFALRSAPPEHLAEPVALPQPRRRPARAIQVAAAAAAVLVAASVGSIFGSGPETVGGGRAESEAARAASQPAQPALDSLNALRDLRVAWLPGPPDLGSSKPALPTQI